MPYIRYEVDEGIATLVIDRPEKRNAMTYPMLDELFDTLERAGNDDKCRVLIFTGSGDAFCAGTDLGHLASIPKEQRGRRRPRLEGGIPWNLTAFPKPIIAAVNGSAVGMGAEFTSHCDVRIASTQARFAWNFAHRGLVPDTGAGTWLLPRLIGVQNALRLIYSGEFISAHEALALGYVIAVVEPDELMAAARTEARRYLTGSPLSHRLAKRLTFAGLSRNLDEHIVDHLDAMKTCFLSHDHAEGVASFLERRSPHFTGN